MAYKIGKDISHMFNLSPRPKNSFNDNVDLNGVREFNSKQILRAHENVTNNIDFFSALKIVGITPIAHVLRPSFHSHGRRFNAVHGVVCRDKHFPISKWLVPELGAQNLHANLANDCMSYDGQNTYGEGNHLMYRAREKLDGEEVVVFGIEAGGKLTYYMWDVDHIYEVQASGPARFERVKDKLYLLSDIPDYELNMPFERHVWEVLSKPLVESAKEGVIMNIDADEYKLVRDPTVTLKVVDNVAYTATYEKIYDVVVPDGLYDFSAQSDYMVRERKDKLFPDSSQAVEVIRRCAVKYDDIDKYFKMASERKLFDTVRISVDLGANVMQMLNSGKVMR